MKRRTFLKIAGMSLCKGIQRSSSVAHAEPARDTAAYDYGSGNFGRWVTDASGLPAYQYTCNQLTEQRAISATNPIWRSPTDHTHQVGNNRIVAVVSNYGYIQVRQDEGSPKYLNDYSPNAGRYGGGVGFLTNEETVLSTYYSATTASFERVFGMGYFRKRVSSPKYAIDQLIFAPFGDDPVLISQITVTNRSTSTVTPRWIEYWGCHNYQFSYRSLMEAAILGNADDTVRLRNKFSDRFNHQFRVIDDSRGLLETQAFQGRSPEEEDLWRKANDALAANPNTFYGGPIPPAPSGAAMEDLQPPSTFLVSLDAPVESYATDGAAFFAGGIEKPQGITKALNNDLGTSGPGSALLLSRTLALQPGETKTLYFLYGYLPESFTLDGLVAKYRQNTAALWAASSAQWKKEGLRLRIPSEPWVERETAWSSYYLRSAITWDSFFHEHILSQGAPYQYVAGLQGAARDPLQHVLPLIFSDPQIVREVIRYTLKETQPDGSLPYGIVGNGFPMPCRYRPSDLQLWLLWLASEYILATRDTEFLDERIDLNSKPEAGTRNATVRELLSRAWQHATIAIGVGEHGLMRLFNGDWNDSIVVNRLSPAQVAEVTRVGESVLNAAMAAYVFDYYARMLDFAGTPGSAAEVRVRAEAQRQAVRKQWTGRWFRRAWLDGQLGWTGDQQLWLEPQPWVLIGASVTEEQAKELVASIDTFARKPSPIGALLQSRADQTMKDETGVGTNGGIFAAINGTLVWGLSLRDGAMAWDEWKKNSLARHAAEYPDLWFGIWSGPDAYNSVLAKQPGSTGLDFPVMNMHSHAWPLYSAAKLLGLEFHQAGLILRPKLPLPRYDFTSPLLGFKKSEQGCSGWYAPTRAGQWHMEIELPQPVRARLSRLEVNGLAQTLNPAAQRISFRGESNPQQPLRWRLF